jgi:RNA polymerase sigma-70 factor (TIGR02957 family)
MTDVTEQHARLRPLVFAVAYGILGSVASAEDIAQEALLRVHRSTGPIDSPPAFAVTVATRLAIDELRSARARREVYVGAWLPEPLLADPQAGPAGQAELADRLSVAFLVMLERLAPVERAVLVLREAFDYDYPQVAAIVGKSVENCRQILARARERVRADRPRFDVDRARRDALAARFFAACRDGDLAGLERLLVEDITLTGDGGGNVPALAAPATGRTRVARFLLGLLRQAARGGYRLAPTTVNGQPGGVVTDAAGATVAVLSLQIAPDGIAAIYNIINPEKLRHLA